MNQFMEQSAMRSSYRCLEWASTPQQIRTYLEKHRIIDPLRCIHRPSPLKNVYTKKKKKKTRKRGRKASAFLLTDLRYVPVMICPDGKLKQKEEKPG